MSEPLDPDKIDSGIIDYSKLPILMCTNGTKHHQWANVLGGRQCQRPGCGVVIRDGVAEAVEDGSGTITQPIVEPTVEELDSPPLPHYADPVSSEKVNHDFDYHPPNDERRAQHEAVRSNCRDLAHFLDDLLPPGREKSLARTHLETVMFWANASVARQGE